jgi:S-adenosylmethionine hydrolase
MSAAVVLVTDYGVDDAYAAALIGAIWRVDPSLRCVAGTHGVPLGDLLAGAYSVKSVGRAFAPGTVICAVVDPGVGTQRGAIAIDAGGVFCVAPDNGLVAYLWNEAPAQSRRCVTVDVPEHASPTFHGRDVFAPVAARLAAGARLEECGAPTAQPVTLDAAFAVVEPGGVAGRVIAVDHFGNAITSVRDVDLDGRRVVAASWEHGCVQEVARTYAEIGTGLAAVLGSAGHVEVAADGRPAASLGGPRRGQVVRVEVEG